jgi:hypothetical protein
MPTEGLTKVVTNFLLFVIIYNDKGVCPFPYIHLKIPRYNVGTSNIKVHEKEPPEGTR